MDNPDRQPSSPALPRVVCPLGGQITTRAELREIDWLAPEVIARLAARKPSWQRADGACPACVQEALLQILTARGEAALHESFQSVWPLDAEAAFGALPTPLRLHADPRYTGAGVALAMVDSAFYPHADLIRPHNRIRAWVDAGLDPVRAIRFGSNEEPRWPDWEAGQPAQWHGLMTSATAAGNGWLSHGLYRGLAYEADLVLVQVRDEVGKITSASIERALRWLGEHGPALGVRVVNLSVAGEATAALAGNAVDQAVASLTAQNITVVAAAGNDGERRLAPPATAPQALTVGGIDDHNLFEHDAVSLWHSNYGRAVDGALKPELVAPSLWVVAPLLPNTRVAAEAQSLFAHRAQGGAGVETQLAVRKLVTPFYQHVEGTSFAAPIVASVIACMLQANPSLTPARICELVVASARVVSGASRERQGAGVIDAGRAVALALADLLSEETLDIQSPRTTLDEVVFQLYDLHARSVEVFGSWNGWSSPGLRARLVRSGFWQAVMPRPQMGRHTYKFLLDGRRWLTDPANPASMADHFGGWNSVLAVRPPSAEEQVMTSNDVNRKADE